MDLEKFMSGLIRRTSVRTGSVGTWSLIMVLLAGCAAVRPASLPPVSEPATGAYRTGEFVWYDLLTEDPQAARTFYGQLFGWRIETAARASDYAVIYNGDRLIGGIAVHENRNPQAAESLWLASLSVADVDRSAAVVREAGGEVLEGPHKVRGRGRMALIEDPMGAPLLLLRSSRGDPTPRAPGDGDWLWTDLVTPDSTPADDFYGRLAGYQTVSVESEGDPGSRLFKSNGRPRAGLVELKWDGVEANWLPYVKVRSLDDVLNRARDLGGRLAIRADNIAVILDPTGAAIGIQEQRKDPKK